MEDYRAGLLLQEMSPNTIRKYLSDVNAFVKYGGEEEATRESVLGYKQFLMERYKPNTVNSRIVSLNRFFNWMHAKEFAVRTERVTRGTGRNAWISLEEYNLLLACALRAHKDKVYALIRTLAGTGIRIGELPYITREAVAQKGTVIRHKGRYREVYLPDELCGLLQRYCESQGIQTGSVFLGRNRKPLEASGIWRTLKRLACLAGVEPEKVYPHSFRHLFARVYLQKGGNIADLADILGHASIETTRLYTAATTGEKRGYLNRLGL